MEDENKIPDNPEGNNPDGGASADDLKIENTALKELLAESKKTIEELNKTLVEVKTTNAKLVNSLDISKNVKDADALLNENFNKYFKKG